MKKLFYCPNPVEIQKQNTNLLQGVSGISSFFFCSPSVSLLFLNSTLQDESGKGRERKIKKQKQKQTKNIVCYVAHLQTVDLLLMLKAFLYLLDIFQKLCLHPGTTRGVSLWTKSELDDMRNRSGAHKKLESNLE